MTGLRIAVGGALVSVVVAGLMTAISGLGGLMLYYANYFQTARMMAPLIVLSLIGIGMTKALEQAEVYFSKWRVQ